jgi:uncharacterized protein YifE (UPF0438 family)
MTAEQLESRFEDLLTRIEDAKRQVDDGTLGDFTVLNKEIAEVCSATQNAPPETAKALQKYMGRIILKLDELAASITTYKDNLLQEKK